MQGYQMCLDVDFGCNICMHKGLDHDAEKKDEKARISNWNLTKEIRSRARLTDAIELVRLRDGACYLIC